MKKILMKDTMDNVKLSKTPYIQTQGKEFSMLQSEEYEYWIKNNDLKTRFIDILTSIGIDFHHNSLYTILIELTKILPLINKNFHLILLGEKALGKSGSYSLVLSEKSKIIAGIPTDAELRGNQKDKNNVPLFEKTILVIEEVADSNTSNSTSLLKTTLESSRYNKFNEKEVVTNSSIVITANSYTQFEGYENITSQNLIQVFPNVFRDEAFMNRFHGILPHYQSIFSNKIYVEKGEGFPIQVLQDVWESFREIPPRLYDIDLEDISERNKTQINYIIDGFVKLFFAKNTTPPNYFVEAIGEWAKYINSLTSFKDKGKSPFNSKFCNLLKELYFTNSDIEYFSFLSDSRVLVKINESGEFSSNAEIMALDGFGVKENTFDYQIFKDNKKSSISDNSIECLKLSNKNIFLSLILDGNIATSKKYTSVGKIISNTLTDHDFNDLLLSEIESQALLSAWNYNFHDLDGLKFKGIPKFYESAIKRKAEELFHVKLDYLPKTTYIISDNNIKFLNFSEIFRKK